MTHVITYIFQGLFKHMISLVSQFLVKPTTHGKHVNIKPWILLMWKSIKYKYNLKGVFTHQLQDSNC